VVTLLVLAPLAAPASADVRTTTAAAARLPAVDMDCKESPVPDQPDQGLAAFFGPEPDRLPPADDPFAADAETTVYEQYGFAGLRWSTYDLGCGPDAAREPDAVIGTSVGNWVMNIPVGLAALTASLTEVAFQPTFLGIFDGLLTGVSGVLHDRLFERWAPAVIALVGLALLVKARGTALASSTAAVLWALFVVVATTALFRWPVEAGHVADDTVTTTLGSVVEGLNGDAGLDPATAVASSLHSSILYPAWVAGQLGSTDSATARKYGPRLFAAQALTWREARLVQEDPDAGREVIDAKREEFGKVADQIRKDDPAAYQFLTGQRSDTRVAYAMLAALATALAVPFLLVSCLLLLGSFLVVRLAVMLFPAFAILGLFPSARGIVIGVGRTVGAALVNAVIFGAGAAVTVVVLGVILDPASALPQWLTLVLLPLFSLIMWVALKPFRRLTAMTTGNADPFGAGAGAVGATTKQAARTAKKAAAGLAAAGTGGAAAGVAAGALADEDDDPVVPDRIEAHATPAAAPDPEPPHTAWPALASTQSSRSVPPPPPTASRPEKQVPAPGHGPAQPTPHGVTSAAPTQPLGKGGHSAAGGAGRPGDVMVLAPDGTEVRKRESEVNPVPPVVIPEWSEGEEIYPIFRPSDEDVDELA
jgi:hypothetical protein